MAQKHANTIKDGNLSRLIDKVAATAKDPKTMRAAFLLSYCAGLRVQEIAGLEWDRHVMVDGDFRMSPAPVYNEKGQPVRVKKTGKVKTRLTPTLYISGDIGKYGSERYIPMPPILVEALRDLYENRRTDSPYVIPSGYKHASQSLKARASALKMRINRMYAAMGMRGFSSHSGRRTFITRAAQKANAYGSSLVDVQALAGHRNLVTTQRYIDISPRQADLVNGLYEGDVA